MEKKIFSILQIYFYRQFSKIESCSFTKNKGNGVKIYDVSKFEENSNSQMLENKNEILFTNCDFDIDEDSGSSINIDRIYKVSKVKINVVDRIYKVSKVLAMLSLI